MSQTDFVYDIDDLSLENTVAGLLFESGLTISTAESCTGGLLAKRLTDIPGASRVFSGGVVAYTGEAKTAMLGVDPSLISEKGAASREVALAMADGVRGKFSADIGVAITGVAGPDSDGSGLEPGTVFIALTTNKASHCHRCHFPHNRQRIRFESASHALDMVRRYLTGLEL